MPVVNSRAAGQRAKLPPGSLVCPRKLGQTEKAPRLLCPGQGSFVSDAAGDPRPGFALSRLPMKMPTSYRSGRSTGLPPRPPACLSAATSSRPPPREHPACLDDLHFLAKDLICGRRKRTSGLLVLENLHLPLCGCTFPGEGEAEAGLSRRTDRDSKAAGWEQARREAAPLRSPCREVPQRPRVAAGGSRSRSCHGPVL